MSKEVKKTKKSRKCRKCEPGDGKNHYCHWCGRAVTMENPGSTFGLTWNGPTHWLGHCCSD